ncbi:MAG: CAP domain-containing protein [Pyrinomonadaceae bacterium]|nr:CAP domain-containing protein [Pyrinomonadaceae bacterium]
MPRRVSSNSVSNSANSNAFAGASSLERRAFELVNAERRARGESQLAWDAQLSQLAREHSQDMARTGSLDHRGADGRDMAERARSFGIRGWRVLGENIAFNQGFDDPSAFAVQRWMGSSKHRANILNGQFTRTGIGVARAADGSIYFTQVFMS